MSTSRRLLNYLGVYKKRLFAGVFFTLLMGLNDSVIAPAMGTFLQAASQIGTNLAQNNRVFAQFEQEFASINLNISITSYHQAFKYLMLFCGGLIVLVIFKGLFVYIKEYLTNSITQKVLMQLRNDLYGHAVYLPLKFFDTGKTGDIMSRVTYDISAIEQSFNSGIVILQAFLYAIIFVTGMFITDWQLSLFAIMVFPVFGIIIKFFATKIRNVNRRIARELAGISSFLQETISSVKIVKSFSREPYEESRFKVKARQYYDYAMKSVTLIAIQKPINEVISIGGTVLLIGFTGFKLLNGTMDIGVLTTFMIFLSMAYKPLKTLGDANPVIQKALASAERIFEIIDEKKEEDYRISTKEPALDLQGAVTFADVHFSYNKNEPVINGLSFSANQGEMIAFVGPSGAGKSTVVNLIMGFYTPQKGDIRFDDKSIDSLYLRDLRENISLVPQETLLFSGSIEENIRYGLLEAGRDDVITAARNANAHDFIQSFPEGYDTKIGEKGIKLSGGQRQRIALARAFLKNPKILILDEATSALDSESEKLVQDAAEKLMVGRTSIVIAHRLSTIQKADKILVLDKGELIQSGTHTQLLRADGIYKRLYEMQFTNGTEHESS